jgi:hypothetical protein
MLEPYKKKTNLFVGVGFIIQIVGRYLTVNATTSLSLALGYLFQLGGIILMVIGCVNYAKGKGYSGAWGLLGILSILGFIALALFPDRHKQPKTT